MSKRPHHFRDNKFNRGHGKNLKYPKMQGADRNAEFIKQQQLTEVEVGITEYVSTIPGFSAVMKARFSDFQVNEIGENGEVAQLTDTSTPEVFEDTTVCEKDLSLVPEEIWVKIDKMLEGGEEPVEFDVTGKEREERTKIHQNIKGVYGSKIIENTVTKDEKKIIQVKKYTKEAARQEPLRWPKDLGEYVHFLVYKEGLDTAEACFRISSRLRMKAALFSYAGNKDRRAKTTQWFSVRKVDPRKLIKQSRTIQNVHIGNFSFKDGPLKLGNLYGNRFRIALRNVTAEDSLINEAVESLEKGFINYYGLQRFGNDKEVPTSEIGLKLLQGDWKGACELILRPKQNDDPRSDITQAKKVFKNTSDPELASKEFNRSADRCVESKLLLGFVKNHKNDYINALENIPRNMRLLYIHSFQSLVWNTVVSRRIKEFGLKPVPGDLVLMAEEKEKLDVSNQDEEDAQGEDEEVKVLSAEDVDQYSIFDIVLPLPGYNMKYPENEVKDWYKEFLEQHNLTLEMPRGSVKTYSLSGTYRKILGKVEKLSWKTLKYNHPNDNLIRSDLEELRGDPEPEDNPNGQYKALVMDFRLKASHYATMVLREVMKTDTSPAAHAKMNSYHKDDPVEAACENSLLNDAAKYEAFKQAIFNVADDSEKRKCEEDPEVVAKKSKVEEVTKVPDSSIGVQSSVI